MHLMASLAKNTILVTFVDRTITRRPIASLTGSYRPSNNYKSSTWSRNITAKLAREYQLRSVFEWPISELGVQCVVYEISDDKSVDEVLKTLAGDMQVESVQRMGIFKMHATTASYRDPYYKLQANMHDLRLEEVHRLTTGKNVKIALIDTGVDLNHPDLKGQISPANNFTGHISKEFSGDLHGTAVAGIIAARANNGIGIVGVAPDSRVIAIKACWPHKQGMFQATCNSLTLALAINRAIKMGVDILNLSLGGPPDPLVDRLIDAAIAKGITVIAADPGIDGAGQRFPASMKNVIAAATTRWLSKETERSKQNHTITAPGIDILTTIPQATYDYISGCSIAAAHVSGVVALLLEINPDLSPHEILNLLETTKKQLDSGGSGEIDILAAISKLQELYI
jgi:subtilisin family serine protease